MPPPSAYRRLFIARGFVLCLAGLRLLECDRNFYTFYGVVTFNRSRQVPQGFFYALHNLYLLSFSDTIISYLYDIVKRFSEKSLLFFQGITTKMTYLYSPVRDTRPRGVVAFRGFSRISSGVRGLAPGSQKGGLVSFVSQNRGFVAQKHNRKTRIKSKHLRSSDTKDTNDTRNL